MGDGGAIPFVRVSYPKVTESWSRSGRRKRLTERRLRRKCLMVAGDGTADSSRASRRNSNTQDWWKERRSK